MLPPGGDVCRGALTDGGGGREREARARREGSSQEEEDHGARQGPRRRVLPVRRGRGGGDV